MGFWCGFRVRLGLRFGLGLGVRVRVRWMSTIGVRRSLGLAGDVFRLGLAFGLGLGLRLLVTADSNDVPPHAQ